MVGNPKYSIVRRERLAAGPEILVPDLPLGLPEIARDNEDYHVPYRFSGAPLIPAPNAAQERLVEISLCPISCF